MNAVIFLASIGFLLPFAAHVFAFRRFSRRIQVRTEALRSSPPARWRDDLPPPVAAFARRCGAGAQDTSSPSAARFSQRADLRLAQGAPFHPIRAEQHVALGGAGFAWDASRWIGPFRSFRVIDAYDSVLGGMLEARLLGSLAVASKSGSDIALGEALRYLAELPWAPDAILGNPAIAWRLTGDRSAEAALSLPEGTARVSFGFDEAGEGPARVRRTGPCGPIRLARVLLGLPPDRPAPHPGMGGGRLCLPRRIRGLFPGPHPFL